MKHCTHLSEIRDERPHTNGCEIMPQDGRHLGPPAALHGCGHVGCCDSSKNKHATKHFHHTKHPIMRSIEPGESWGWCYVDEVQLNFG